MKERFNRYNCAFVSRLFSNARARGAREITEVEVREALLQVPGYYEDFRDIMEPVVKRRLTLDEMVIVLCMDLEAHPVKFHTSDGMVDIDDAGMIGRGKLVVLSQTASY